MTRTARLLALALTALAPACQSTGRDLAHENLHSVLWMQTAAEYRAVASEIFELAEMRLDEALADPSWSAALEQGEDFDELPPAVILDVDETSLDNTPFGARLIVDERPFSSELWSEWVRQERARAVPGAVAFTDYARRRGVAVFFVTNRSRELDAHTARNLAAVGFPVKSGGANLLSVGSVPSAATTSAAVDEEVRRSIVDRDKSQRRRLVARRHRVLLLVGDDLNDFVSSISHGPEERSRLASKYAARWGHSWILLPNPIYGSWVTALTGTGDQPPRSEVLERIRGWLDIFK